MTSVIAGSLLKLTKFLFDSVNEANILNLQPFCKDNYFVLEISSGVAPFISLTMDNSRGSTSVAVSSESIGKI